LIYRVIAVPVSVAMVVDEVRVVVEMVAAVLS
jgi:hypothetical protein